MDVLKLEPSAEFLQVLKELQHCQGVPEGIKEYFKSSKPNSASSSVRNRKQDKNVTATDPKVLLLTVNEVKWCHYRMRERGFKQRIHSLLNSSRLILPKYEPAPRNPELEARIQKLKREQEQKEYDRMTSNIRTGTSRISVAGVGQELKALHSEMNRYLVTGFQYILSVVGVFFAVYVATGFAAENFPFRILLSLMAAIVVGLAELYFIIKADLIQEEVQSKRKKLSTL